MFPVKARLVEPRVPEIEAPLKPGKSAGASSGTKTDGLKNIQGSVNQDRRESIADTMDQKYK